MPLTRAQAYTEAGVNIDAGNSLVSRIKSIVSQTHIHGVLSDIGGFGGLSPFSRVVPNWPNRCWLLPPMGSAPS